MSKRGTLELLEDISDSIRRILDYTGGLNYEKFSKSPLIQDAVVRNFQVLGEATKKLPATFRKQHSKVPWSKVARFRDKLVHHYSGVNYDVVWEIIEESLPELQGQIRQILKRLK
jgi:uncharacterized protein with HEPN domain